MILKNYIYLLISLFLLNSAALAKDEFEDEADKKKVGTVIGIDLGTTYSVVAVYQNGKVEIISNELGNRITPSYVAFTNDERLVGESAKNQASMNPKNTIFASKRLIGRKFAEKSVRQDIKYFPYEVIEKDGRPVIRVTERNKPLEQTPTEIGAIILSKMKKIAEKYLGHEVTHAVITVPAYFNDAQRKATKDAGKIAGLTVMRIINEPTAAAIAYGINRRSSKENNVLVFDLGGGTFDVSLLTVADGVFEVKATNGNTHLGGEDIDLNLAKHFADIFKEKTKVDLLKDDRAFSRLKAECEMLKRQLSSDVKASIDLESLSKGFDFKETMTRAEFEKINGKLLRDTIKPVQTVLADAKMSKAQVNEIVLVGGSTRIPMIRKLLENFFEGKKLHTEINPDEAVAYGAAVQAMILSGEDDENLNDVLLLDVTPMSLGIETVGGVFSKVLEKNMAIPTSKSQIFTTNENDQTGVNIAIFEGEAKMTRFNHLLGKFELSGIDKAPRGVPQIEVTFEIDANGILDVSAKDKSSGKNNKIKIDEAMSGHSSDEVNKMKENFEKHQEEDEKIYNRTIAKNKLTNALHQAADFKTKNDKKLSKDDLDDLENFIQENTKWNEAASAAETEAADFEAKAKAVEEFLKELESGEAEGGEEDDEDDEEKDDKKDDGKKEL